MSEHQPIGGFGTLFDRVSVIHASQQWSETMVDVSAVCGAPHFSDGSGWATWDALSVSDETDGPAWCLLARTPNLEAVAARAEMLGWETGDVVTGRHERRVSLTAPSGLVVIGYSPTLGT